MKEFLSWEDKNRIRLAMLDEVDAFCRSHGIRYSLACGTMLGAVRHGGFIPWDDDMDIMMPRPDLERFKREFVSENIQFMDLDVSEYYSFAFPRLVDRHSYSKPGKVLVGPGLEIDVYPVIGIPAEKEAVDAYFKEAQKLLKRRLAIMKWRSRLIRRFPVKTIPFFRTVQKKYRDLVFRYPYGANRYHLVVSGALDWAHTYDYDLFAEMTDLEFEEHRYMAIARYKDYLAQRYGDYMQLPPEDQRVPYHGGSYFKIDSPQK